MGLIIKNNVVYNGAESEPIIYSEEEREVGCWVDGKPLYQKTFYYASLPSNSSDWQLLQQSYPLEELVTYNAMCAYSGDRQLGNGTYITISYYNENLYYHTPHLSGGTLTDVYVTIQYTKTTDTPGSGTWTPSGVKTVHYSENEQVIGTWIDGSTIYERTYVLTNSINVNNYNWTSTSIPVNDMNKIINCWGMHESGTYWGDLCAALNINTYINLKCSRNGDTIDLKIFTIQYTKTAS